MKKVVIDAAVNQAVIGTVQFTVDPEIVRDKRTEPVGSYPDTGTVSIFLDYPGDCIACVIEYDGETRREDQRDPIAVRNFRARLQRGQP